MPATGARGVVVIEDDPDVRDLLVTILEGSGYAVTATAYGRDGLEAVRSTNPDVITLDLALPDLDGLELCRMIRDISAAYVIILTARADELDRLMGLETGADDYMTKPFSPRELRARVAAMLRRPRTLAAQPATPSSLLRHGHLSVDVGRRTTTLSDHDIALTRTEFDLLATLARSPLRVWTRHELVESVWGSSWRGDDHLVDVHVNNIRRKLATASSGELIATVRGVGFRLEDTASSASPS
jgi:two-component system, OmpR family, response regulator